MRDEEKNVMREPQKRKKLQVFIKKIRDDDQGVKSGFKGYQGPQSPIIPATKPIINGTPKFHQKVHFNLPDAVDKMRPKIQTIAGTGKIVSKTPTVPAGGYKKLTGFTNK